MLCTRKLRLAVVITIALALPVGCSTPEAGRPRGAGYGTGADPDNHPPAGQFEPCSKVFNDECNP